MTALERAVLELILAGDHPVLDVLRRQVPGLSVSARSTEFSVDPTAIVAKGRAVA